MEKLIHLHYKQKTPGINLPVFFVKNFEPFRNIIMSYDLMIWHDPNTSKIIPIKS